MKMTPTAVVIGVIFRHRCHGLCGRILHLCHKDRDSLSEIFRPMTAKELEGRAIYMANGCLYCHSQATAILIPGFGVRTDSQAGRLHRRQT